MVSKDELVQIILASNERQPHQRWHSEIKSAPDFGIQQIRKPPFPFGKTRRSPIVFEHLDLDVGMHDLTRLLAGLPVKRCAENWMTRHDLLPRAYEGLRIEWTTKFVTDDDGIHARSIDFQRVIQHSVLHWGELIHFGRDHVR
jgi:hypothetical protein